MDIVGRVGYEVASIHYQDLVFLVVLTPGPPQTPSILMVLVESSFVG